MFILLPTGIFNQYDTMIYPPSESLLKHFKGIVSRQEVGKTYWPSPEQMRKDCLVNYLAVYEPVLKSECTPDSASTIVSEVLHIYLQLAEHLLYTDSKISMAPPSFETWPVGNFKNVRINRNFSLRNMHIKLLCNIKCTCNLFVCIHVSYHNMTELMDMPSLQKLLG